MLSTVLKRAVVSRANLMSRSMSSTPDTALDAFHMSCFQEMDYTIADNATVQEAVNKLTAFDIGCLITTDTSGNLTGVVSERDVIMKVALLNVPTGEIKVNEIFTPNPIAISPEASVDECMEIMLKKDIRHLPLLSETGGLVGLISIKDCIKTVLDHHEETIAVLSNFAMGKGGTFVCD